MSSSSSFSLYCSPPNGTQFSASTFSCLTFGDAEKIALPLQLEKGALISFTWSNEEPILRSCLEFSEREPVLHPDDVLSITSNMEKEFSRGTRSVYIGIKTLGDEVKLYQYHLVKVCCFSVSHRRMFISGLPYSCVIGGL